MTAAIIAQNLVKVYGKVRALDGVSLEVAEGTVLGLLGPNGAGKTTVVRILTSLTKPDEGRATVLGLDVGRQASVVRERIGLSGQYAAVDENLTGRENLVMVGRLYHLGRKPSRARAEELLDGLMLSDAADRQVKTYSGGVRRRLDLAATLIAAPPVIFLDEPTTGLDPRSRMSVWDLLGDLVKGGTTLLLTTQYLEEADRLASEIVVVDHGRVIARGTADQLKEQVGGVRVRVVVHDRDRLATAARLLSRIGIGEAHVDDHLREITVPVRGGAKVLMNAIRILDDESIDLDDAGLRKPTLDDVFLTLTGTSAMNRQPSPLGPASPVGPRVSLG